MVCRGDPCVSDPNTSIQIDLSVICNSFFQLFSQFTLQSVFVLVNSSLPFSAFTFLTDCFQHNGICPQLVLFTVFNLPTLSSRISRIVLFCSSQLYSTRFLQQWFRPIALPFVLISYPDFLLVTFSFIRPLVLLDQLAQSDAPICFKLQAKSFYF